MSKVNHATLRDVNAQLDTTRETPVCKACKEPLSKALLDVNADWHVMCFPEPEWQEWLKGQRNVADK